MRNAGLIMHWRHSRRLRKRTAILGACFLRGRSCVRLSPRLPASVLSWLIAYLGLGAAMVHAEFSVCNQSLDVLNVAIGYEQDGDFQTEGWWSVGANRCVDVVREPLKMRYIYVYAEDVFGQAVAEGNVASCVDNKRFLIRGTTDCWIRGHKEAHFLEVDTKSQERWTLFLKSPD
jgi:uncharacterized membrane protein